MSNPIPVNRFVQERYAFESVDRGRNFMRQQCQVVELLSGLHHEDWTLEENFWGPSLLLQTAVDSQLPAGDHLGLVNEATSYALGVYSGAESIEERLVHLQRIGRAFEDFDLLDNVVQQPQDDVTIAATDFPHSYNAARRLIRDVRGDLLFVPLSPRGLVAGIQTALYFERLRSTVGEYDSTVFPVPFTPESGDTQPYVRDDEMVYLRSLAANRTTVVTVESAIRSDLATALPYFRKQLGVNVVGAVAQL